MTTLLGTGTDGLQHIQDIDTGITSCCIGEAFYHKETFI